MKKIFVSIYNFDNDCAEAKKLLDEHGFEIINHNKMVPYTYEELVSIVPDIDAAIVGIDIWDESIFKLAPKLKTLARFGVGVDNVNIPDATKYGIKVFNTKGANAQAAAELTLTLMLCCARNVCTLNRKLSEDGTWLRSIGFEISGKTVGLIGFGDIGKKVAKLLKGFDATILACDPLIDAATAAQYGARLAGLDEVLSNSDIVSLHIPGTEDNYHFMNAERLSKMKKGSILINAARGILLDEQALISAIHSGHISGAGIDVYKHEPLEVSSPLLKEERITCLPHTSADTVEACRNVGLSAVRDTIAAFEGGIPKNWLNKQ